MSFDRKLRTEANGLFHALSSDRFIVALHCNVFVSGYLNLCQLLQGSHLDTFEAYSEINNTIEVLTNRRLKADETFPQIFKSASVLTSLDGTEAPVIPRLGGRQTHRNNSPAATADEYWRISVFIPFLDSLVLKLKCRFVALSHAEGCASFAVSSKQQLLPSDIRDIRSAYKPDLLESISIHAEVERRQKKWVKPDAENLPSTLKQAIQDLNARSYPNIHRILHLLTVIPVTSANVERANSSLKYIKAELRSSMGQACLNALVLLYIHKSLPLDLDRVLDRFATAHPRRMLLVSPLQDQFVDNGCDL